MRIIIIKGSTGGRANNVKMRHTGPVPIRTRNVRLPKDYLFKCKSGHGSEQKHETNASTDRQGMEKESSIPKN